MVERFSEIIKERGWHIMQVRNGADQSGPTVSYSTGIYKNLGKPELIIFGLSEDLEGSIINNYGNAVETVSRTFEAGAFYRGFIEGFDICLIEANEIARKNFAVWADWYYERAHFPLLQCVYPNTSGVWPWEAEASEWFREIQPVFGPIPEAITKFG